MKQHKAIGLKKALELMRVEGHRLMIMHSPRGGREYYIVPGGLIEVDTAQKIIARPDVIPQDDGLFPGHPQTWKMGIS